MNKYDSGNNYASLHKKNLKKSGNNSGMGSFNQERQDLSKLWFRSLFYCSISIE